MTSGSTSPGGRPVLTLMPGREKRLKQGNPWVFSNEVVMDAAAKALPAGSAVTLQSAEGQALGVALFNPRTLIATRMLDRDTAATLDAGFIARRLKRALSLRERLIDQPCYRLVHAEADGLPGVVIDRFGDVVVVQVNTAGMDLLTQPLLQAIDQVLQPRAVVLRNDSSARATEGLGQAVTVVKGAIDGPVKLVENGATFFADVSSGQKTGWFFDQRDNRAFMARLARRGVKDGAPRVLDLYTHTGGFGIQAAMAGAGEVVLVDRSELALSLAELAAKENGVAERCRFVRAEVFGEAERMGNDGERFDVVIADPPAFVKSRKDLAAGVRGYRKLARLAARLTLPGGILFIASCSHNVEPNNFADQVKRGLADAGRAGRILRVSGAGPDHPVHPFLPETAYLKAMVLAVD